MKIYSLYAMAAFYILAGVNHFRDPTFYLKMMPKFLPWHKGLNYLSGLAEILLGAGLFFEQTRTYALWGIIALLVAVFPANLEMVNSPDFKQIDRKWKLLRLPIQLVFIAWAAFYLL